ncbi:MAG: hypothetical protein Q9M19_05245 [Mariprofundaceae bacterium]|nr:hypothetical protein [Mariprofundaceae bacterium]
MFIRCFNRGMEVSQQEQDVQSRVQTLAEHLATIRRNHEKTLAENKRLREVVRLAESELRKRREQIEKLQHEYQNLQNKRLEAKARVEHVLEKVDLLSAEHAGNQP